MTTRSLLPILSVLLLLVIFFPSGIKQRSLFIHGFSVSSSSASLLAIPQQQRRSMTATTAAALIRRNTPDHSSSTFSLFLQVKSSSSSLSSTTSSDSNIVDDDVQQLYDDNTNDDTMTTTVTAATNGIQRYEFVIIEKPMGMILEERDSIDSDGNNGEGGGGVYCIINEEEEDNNNTNEDANDSSNSNSNSAAYRAGIRTGDVVEMINGKNVLVSSFDTIMEEFGTSVAPITVTVQRPSSVPVPVSQSVSNPAVRMQPKRMPTTKKLLKASTNVNFWKDPVMIGSAIFTIGMPLGIYLVSQSFGK